MSFGWSAHADTLVLDAARPEALQRAVELLRRGEAVAFATDTVYGVGAHALMPAAVQRLYLVKDRPPHLAIPLLLPDADAMREVCTAVPALAWELAARFWPGGLSLVLPRTALVPDAVTAGGPTVAVRVPDYGPARELCRLLGAPLAATSANRHGRPAPVTAEEVWAQLAGRVALILDGGPCPGGVASTVLDLSVQPPAIVRPGAVVAEELEPYLRRDA